MFQQAWQLLSFKAFRPDVLDVKVPLAVRMQGKSAVAVVFSSRCMACARVHFGKGGLEVSEVKNFVLSTEKEKTATLGVYAKEQGLDQVIVFCSPGFEVIKHEEAVSFQGIERLRQLQAGMPGVSGFPSEEGRVHAYVTSELTGQSLFFSYLESGVRVTGNLVRNAGLQVLRVSCGVYTTLEYLARTPALFEEDALVFVYCSNALFLASIKEGRFDQTCFRSKACFREFDQLVPKALERFGDVGSKLHYVNFSDWDLEGFFGNQYPDLEFSPLFKDCREGLIQGGCYG